MKKPIEPDMIKAITQLILTLIVSGVLMSSAVAQSQQWECALNLQQGDTGTMSLNRQGDKVEGMIKIVRNANDFDNEVNGSWNDNVISLNRLLDANSNEPMDGLIVTLGTEKVKMGGRFSSQYQGVWSADCDLVASEQSTQTGIASEPGSEAEAATKVVPSITSRTSPSTPNSKDRIKVSARASHPEGIQSLDFYLGDKKVHSCEADACEFDYGVLRPGKYLWHVQAVSKSGVSSVKRVNTLVVNSVSANTCRIQGLATGPSANLSISYRVILLGVGKSNGYSKVADFNQLEYSFTQVPRGEYSLSVDTLADSSVLASPRSASLRCGVKTEMRQNFDFR